jgi:hypothetical protein
MCFRAQRDKHTLLDAAEQVWSPQKIPQHEGSAISRFLSRNIPTTNSGFLLDTTSAVPQNSPNFSRGLYGKVLEAPMQYLPGWTVQCINAECMARGTWLRADQVHSELCTNCGAPLHRVPPPLGPRMRMRPRTLSSYRPFRPR